MLGLAKTSGTAARLRALCDRLQYVSAEVQRNEASGTRATQIRSALTFANPLDNLLTDASLFVVDMDVKVALNDGAKFSDGAVVVFTDAIFVCLSKRKKDGELVCDEACAVATSRVSELPPRGKAKHLVAIANNLTQTTYILSAGSFADHSALLRALKETMEASAAGPSKSE